MSKLLNAVRTGALLVTLARVPIGAQAPAPSTDPGLLAARMANMQMPLWLTKAGEMMTEDDFAFRPTADVRTFGQILAHVADQDYLFCASAKGEKPPVQNLEKTATTRTDIRKAMAGAIAYCNDVYATMTDSSARAMMKFGTRPMPALSLLIFRTHHASLHYGNVITYMRLRGKVPPSTG